MLGKSTNIAFASQSGATANLSPSRFNGEHGPSAPKPVKGLARRGKTGGDLAARLHISSRTPIPSAPTNRLRSATAQRADPARHSSPTSRPNSWCSTSASARQDRLLLRADARSSRGRRSPCAERRRRHPVCPVSRDGAAGSDSQSSEEDA